MFSKSSQYISIIRYYNQLKFDLDDIGQADFIYTALIKKDGTKMYQIHKCCATGKTGIISENDFEKLLSIYYPNLSTNDNLVIDKVPIIYYGTRNEQ